MNRNGIQPDGSVVLPPFSLYGNRGGRIPWKAPVLLRRTLENDHGTPIDFAVQRNRTGTAFWFTASREGFCMSDGLRTGSRDVANRWVAALEAGDVTIARHPA